MATRWVVKLGHRMAGNWVDNLDMTRAAWMVVSWGLKLVGTWAEK